jgi:hypothetical protein
MADQAKITNLDVLETLRSQLIIFQTKAKRALEETQNEVKRTRQWLRNDAWVHWETVLKKRMRQLEQAEAELTSARFSAFVDNPTMQQMQVRKARHKVEEAQAKLNVVKKWNRDYDHHADPLYRKLESLTYYLEHDIPRAIAYLRQATYTLEAYGEI